MNERINQVLGAFVRRAQTSEDREHYRAVVRLARLRWYGEAETRLRWMERDLMDRAAMAAECRARLIELKNEDRT